MHTLNGKSLDWFDLNVHDAALRQLLKTDYGDRVLNRSDMLSVFLALASIGLAIAFATLLGDIRPGSAGSQVPLSTVQALSQSRELSAALSPDWRARTRYIAAHWRQNGLSRRSVAL